MKKLMLSALAVAAMLGVATAQAGGAESEAGSAWRQQPDFGPVPGTPEYYGNSGGPVQLGAYPYGYGSQAAPAYPYERPERARRRDRDWDRDRDGDGDGDGARDARSQDRDGDGVRNRRDRYPNDPRRW